MRKTWVALLLVLAACGGSPTATTNPSACKPQGILGVGESIPSACSFVTLDGSAFRLADLKGTPALINFWATWCPNCIEEMPALEEASRALAGKARVIGFDLVNVDGETVAAARSFVNRLKITYPIVQDTDGRFYAHFSARNLLPTTIWVDANGVIRHRKFGPLDVETIVQSVRTHLGVS